MILRHFVLLFFTGLLLSGCDNRALTGSCSSTDTQKVIGSLLTEQTQKLTAEKKYDYYDGSFVLVGSKIRAVLAQVQVTVENAKMIKQDPNSSIVFCGGQLKVTVPEATLADVDQTREMEHQTKIAQYAGQLNIKNSNNVFTQDVEYSVKRTDTSKEPVVDFESDAWAHLLDEITTSALLKPTLDGQEIQESYYVQDDPQPTQEIDLKPEVGASLLGSEKMRAIQEKRGLEKLNQELLEAEQAEQEILKEKVAAQSSSTANMAKQISPSFNCAKATKVTEAVICANAELAALDVENMKLYKNAKNIDAVATHEIWKASIKSKYACGTNVDCIKEVYKESMLNYGCISSDNDSDCGVDAPQESEHLSQ
ncbi:lysozyme inhibitor LprI family protein [Candidatus Methylobacter oryzae]|uniref:Lipoprotein n=1 Tax=Candidatus Methylobacter oryzae TaxID=2497749 RepID=A0ABY3CEW5_9GAMM|nr:hypothetical protein [Candidatus Methylobacter oryzae]TRX01917.1 hypothetical protein EKO24_003180 [Candidatus Methylobacter oryzae]